MVIASIGRKSKNSVRSELVASETSLPLLPAVRLHVVVDLHEVGRLAAHRRAVIDDLDLQFLGCLIDDGHNFLLFLAVEFAGERRSCAVGSDSPARPKAAK